MTEDNEVSRDLARKDYLKFLRAQLYSQAIKKNNNFFTKLFSFFGRQGGGSNE